MAADDRKEPILAFSKTYNFNTNLDELNKDSEDGKNLFK